METKFILKDIAYDINKTSIYSEITNFDKNCPLKVRFKNVGFNLDVKQEEFIFEIE